MSLQTITLGSIRNHQRFGMTLQDLCQSDGALSLMPGFGFMDGGCYALAMSLRDWLADLNPEIWVAGRRDRLDHAVCCLHGFHDGMRFLDGDGLSSADDLRRKMRDLEGLPAIDLRPASNIELVEIKLRAEQHGLDRQRLVALLAKHLNKDDLYADCRPAS